MLVANPLDPGRNSIPQELLLDDSPNLQLFFSQISSQLAAT